MCTLSIQSGTTWSWFSTEAELAGAVLGAAGFAAAASADTAGAKAAADAGPLPRDDAQLFIALASASEGARYATTSPTCYKRSIVENR